MNRFRPFSALALIAALSVPATVQGQSQFNFISGSGEGYWPWGAQVGPYKGQLGGPGSPTIDIYCVDYFHFAGGSWDVWESSLAGDLSNTYLAKYGTLTQTEVLNRYKQAAWLAMHFTPSNKSEWGAIHGAIWYVMSGGTATRYGGSNTVGVGYGSDSWRLDSLATGDWQNINLSEWTVLSDVNGPGTWGGPYSGKQEYLVRNVVPEPETFVLLGSGLLALGLIFYYRRGTPL